ncbi:MAG TPA: MmcQ/YjbR family DNA-binding protein [Xanthomonadaceae bacterium]|nr:MmcQ/YjbR family DNA-binding protein [Xanthomonadaceae bacterium]
MRIAQVRGFVLALPEVTEQPHFQLASFRIRGKIIATIPPGDKFLHVFVSDEERDLALAMEPGFIEKLYWGERAAGLRIVLAKAKPGVVKRLLVQAWMRKAPKSLHGQI